MTSWVSVSFAIEILHCVDAASFAATTAAPPRPCSRRGRIPRASRPETVTLPLCSRTNASPFCIMLLLSLGVLEHGMIDASRTPDRAPDYESGGQEFESLPPPQLSDSKQSDFCTHPSVLLIWQRVRIRESGVWFGPWLR